MVNFLFTFIDQTKKSKQQVYHQHQDISVGLFKNMNNTIERTLAIFAVGLSATITNGTVLEGPILNPANGHSYYLLSQNTWTAAEAEAVALEGHLATVNDAAENAWINNTFSAPHYYLWIGLNDADVEGQFVWASGQQATYRNWFAGEPNSFGGDEDYVLIYNFDSGFRRWNDMPNVDNLFVNNFAYPIYGVAEIENELLPNSLPTISPIAGLAITSGTSSPAIPFIIGDAETPADSLTLTPTSSNLSLVPVSNITLSGTGTNRSVAITPAANQLGRAVIGITVTDIRGGTATASFTVYVISNSPSAIFGPIINPANGNTYYLLDLSSWSAAETAAVSLGGHLVTIRNQSEQDWVYTTFGNIGGVARNLWIGLHDPDPINNATNPATRMGEFVWSSAETVSFSNWNSGEPNNYLGAGEFFVHLWLPGLSISSLWNDYVDSPSNIQPGFPLVLLLMNGVVELTQSVNHPPMFRAIADQTVKKGDTLTVPVSVSDSDLPDQTLTFSLGPGAPAGATIDPATGLFTWTPMAAQEPGVYSVSVIVVDSGTPPLSATNTFSITVSEGNSRPIISPILDQDISVGQTLVVTIAASDADLPAQILSYSLGAAAPTGAVVDQLTGLITWTPTSAQATSTNTFVVQVSDSGTPPLSDTKSFVVRVQDVTPASLPSINLLLGSTNVVPGGRVTFSIAASGTPPLTYQWRRNGTDIAGETNAVFVIPSVQVADGGSYSVVVANPVGATQSPSIDLLVIVPVLPPGDNFAGRVALTNVTVRGSNANATSEVGEPLHAGRRGGKSVWYSWVSPNTGIASFDTAGSTFDTLLAVYFGTRLAGLTSVASDEDQGGFFTSKLQFNAVAGVEYEIAIDGFAGAAGDFVLNWSVETTLEIVPGIQVHPQSQTVTNGANVTFSVVANGTSYQWFLDGRLLTGAINSTLTINNVRTNDLGLYVVQVSAGTRAVDSSPASLQIGPDPKVQGEDKLSDRNFGEVSRANISTARPRARVLAPTVSAGWITVPIGQSRTNILSNKGLTTEEGEPLPRNLSTHATVWYDLMATNNGVFVIDTGQSPIETQIGVYQWQPRNIFLENPTNYFVGFTTNRANDPNPAFVRFAATNGSKFRAVADGLNGAVGDIHLRCRFGTQPLVNAGFVTVTNTITPGGGITLNAPVVEAQPEPTYLWNLNGTNLLSATNIISATSSNLVIFNFTPANAGTYSVIVSNFAGTVTNRVAEVNLPAPPPPPDAPTLQISRAGNAVIIAWLASAAEFQLESIDNITLPNWTPVPTLESNGFNTVTIDTASGIKFYRLRRP